MPEFRPPPGWPPTPPGWVPPPGWSPDPAWPPAPPGWQFYTAGPGGRRVATRPRIALAAGLAVVLVVLGVVAVRALTGHESFDVVENGFIYRVRIAEVTRPTESNGLIAKPGYAYVRVSVDVENRQSDRSAPALVGVRAIAAPPSHTLVLGGSPGLPASCQVTGAGPGQVSPGVNGLPPGWCFFAVAADQDAPPGAGPLPAGGTVRSTYDSAVAFSEALDEGVLHVYTRTGGSDTVEATALDLGPAD